MMIMRVMRMLSETQIEKYAIMWTPNEVSPTDSAWNHKILATASATLAQSVAVSSRKSWVRTDGSEVHQGWESNGPAVHRINHKTTVHLKDRPTSDS